MSMRFSIKVDQEIIQKHIVAYLVVTEILRQQSQPIHLSDGDAKGLVFDLRVNLQQQQCRRLIENQVRENLPDYSVSVDWGNKKMMVTSANKARRKKPAKSREPDAGRGDSDIQQVI